MMADAQEVLQSTTVDDSHENTYLYSDGVVEVPDGLCGGPLAYVMGAPLILTGPNYTPAADYMAEIGIESGIALGGTGALSEDVVRNIFAMSATDKIVDKKYN